MSDDNLNNNNKSWSQYEMMVLQKLNDHNILLKTLTEQIIKINSDMRVSDSIAETWRKEFTTKVTKIEDNIDTILNSENGINSRLKKIEQEDLIEDRIDSKSKAIWAVIGGAVVFVGNIGIQIATMFFHN